MATVGALLLTAPLMGCADSSDGGGDPAPALEGDPIGSWPASEGPLPADVVVGEASTEGEELVLADGTRLDAGTPVGTYVVAGDGAFVVPASDPTEDGFAELLAVTADDVEATGAHPDPATLATSPDGHYLGFLDRGSEGTAPAVVTVVDLEAREEVVRTDEGMGSSGEDLTDLDEETGPTVLGIDAETAYVATTGPVLSFALPSGVRAQEAEEVEQVYDTGWFRALREPGATQVARRADEEPRLPDLDLPPLPE